MLKKLCQWDKKLVIKFAVSLFVTIFLAVMFFGLCAYAETTETAGQTAASAEAGDYLDTPAQNVGDSPTSSVLQEVIGVDASQPLEVILLLTLIGRLQLAFLHLIDFSEFVIISYITIQLLILHVIDKIDHTV